MGRPPASLSRNASTRTYSVGSSTLRDHSNHRQPGSARVALVNSALSSVQFGVLGTDAEFGGNEDHGPPNGRSSDFAVTGAGYRSARPGSCRCARSYDSKGAIAVCVSRRKRGPLVTVHARTGGFGAVGQLRRRGP